MEQVLEFEKPIVELERKIAELKKFQHGAVTFHDELEKLEKKVSKVREDVFTKLTAMQKVQLSRHPLRPYTLDYIGELCTDFVELHGDRCFSDDPAIVAGMAKLDGESVFIIGHQKGRTTKEKVYRNFGMPLPDGYRKALRVAQMAERFKKPLFCFIDTPGAYPGLEAEERGQAEAIAHNLEAFACLRTQIIVTVIGEGGSGGALAIGIGDAIYMQEYATYSVISPEGCAAILWRDPTNAPQAAEALKITADDIKRLGVIDDIIAEPSGGAHRNPKEAARLLKSKMQSTLAELKQLPIDELLDRRLAKFRGMGVFTTEDAIS